MTKNTLFEDWKHFIGMPNTKGKMLIEEMLYNWAETDGRLECKSCGTVHNSDARYCRTCREYEYLQPYIAEWSESNG